MDGLSVKHNKVNVRGCTDLECLWHMIMEDDDEDFQRIKMLKSNGRNFCEENFADEQYFCSNTQQIPKDVIGYIIILYPYSWLSVSKYF